MRLANCCPCVWWDVKPYSTTKLYIQSLLGDDLCSQGRVVALDKTVNKITKLIENIERWNITCVEAYNFDATKSLDQTAGSCFIYFNDECGNAQH